MVHAPCRSAAHGHIPLAVAVLAVSMALPPTRPARAASVECRIDGVSNEAILRNIEATVSIARLKDRDDLDAARIAQLHERAPMEIRRAVEPFGYFHPAIDTSLVRDGEDEFVARYQVELGPPVRVQSVAVSVTGEGKAVPPFPKLAAEFPLQKGDVLDQRLYESRKNTFVSAAADSGYLDASFPLRVIRIDRERNTADIELTFDTGPRYRFGAVTFDSSAVDERVMRTYLTFKPGDPFRYDRLLAFQSALGGTPYFSRVEAVALRDQAADHAIPIHVRLTSQRPRRYEVGVGYGTDTGPRVLVDAQFRRLNRAGHRYRGRANISQLEISLRAEYVIPSLYPNIHTYTISAVVARLDPDAYTTNRAAIGPTRSQPRFGWLESLTVSYEYEDYTVGSDDGISKLIVGGVAYRMKKADDDIAPTHGFRVDLGLRGAEEALLSTDSFASFTARAKWLRSLGDRFRVIARLDAGATWTSAFRDLPPTIRFFAGGDNSVRGYDYESLGPLDETGQVIGGDHLLTTSLEIDALLVGKFGLAAFFDAGNAFASLDEGTVEQGTGLGLRWRSPIGPIRLDVAYAVHHDHIQVHFTMGPDL